MSRWLEMAGTVDSKSNYSSHTHHKPSKTPDADQVSEDRAPFLMVYDRCREGKSIESFEAGTGNQPFENSDMRHGRAVNGYPKTWTGKIVSPDVWHELTEWERHGPDGRLWCGACWEWVTECAHTVR